MFYDLHSKLYKLDPLFQAVENCKGVRQKSEYHPEGDVFNHSIQTMFMALKETTDIDLIFAALLHDIGKAINSKGHENYAVELLDGYISEKTKWLIENHMRIWYFLLGDMKKRSKVKELHSHKWFADLVLLARWDKMGRNPNWFPKYSRKDIIEKLRGRLGGDF